MTNVKSYFAFLIFGIGSVMLWCTKKSARELFALGGLKNTFKTK